MKNQVQLIAYVDRLGGSDIRSLSELLRGQLRGLFGAVHLLPFFETYDGADAGFDPIDHTRVDPRLGDWGDIRALTREIDVMADVIVNHASADSVQFRDFLAHGEAAACNGLFLTEQAVFPAGATADEVALIYRPRPGAPFTRVALADGSERTMWTTFTPTQIDIDVRHPQGREYLQRIVHTFSANGVRMVRLDAIGYAIKKAGTSCFMIPETFDFIGEFAAGAARLGLEVLVEVHAYYRRQIEIAQRVDYVYDFALPPLVLHAFAYKTPERLKEWIRIRPVNALTVLDTHDGIGIVDVGADPADRDGSPGLVPPTELDGLVDWIHRNSGGASRKATGGAAANLDLYQINCTFYDALGRSDHDYLLARAVQLFLPGVPQIYYVGLLAGTNDLELLARSGVGRDINRHYYSAAEIDAALKRPCVRDLLSLIRFRNSHPAFGGRFELLTTDASTLALRWTRAGDSAELTINFVSGRYSLWYTAGENMQRFELAAASGARAASRA
jgi:sucrose phosphorylase